MATTTTGGLALPVPELGDTDNVPADMLTLANAVEAALVDTNTNVAANTSNISSARGDLDRRPVGDSGNSRARTTDLLCTGGARTDLITRNFTLGNDQWVILSAKARFDNSGGAVGDVGLTILVNGVVGDEAQAGPVHVGTSSPTDRATLVIPAFSVFMSSGSHTVILQADRDGTGVITAVGSGTINSRSYQPTSLSIIV